jgi:PST family polysaccharide transporter
MSTPQKIVRGFFYTLGSGYAARLGSLVVTVLLKRHLDPEVFDITLKGLVIFIVLSSLRDFGWLHSLLHFQDKASEFVQTHFVLNLGISLLVCLLCGGVGWGLYVYDPEIYAWPAAVICMFSGLYLIRSLTQTSEALLRKEFEFGRLALFHGLATALSLGSALLTAWMGWGKWSLVLGGWTTFSVFSVVYTLVYCTAVWYSAPIKLWPLHFDRTWARRLLKYGGWFWVAWGVLLNLIWYCDKLVLSFKDEVVEKHALAFYENAWWLMQLPTAIIAHIIFPYTNALYSRYQRDRERLGELFSRIMGLIFRGSTLVALLLVLNAHELTGMLGPRWEPAAAMMIWLAGYAFLRPLFDEGIGLLWAVGDTWRTAMVMGVQLLVAAPLVWVVIDWWGVKGLACSMGVIAGVGLVGLFAALRRHVEVAWARIFGAPVLALLAAGAAGLAYDRLIDLGWLMGLLARSGSAALVYAAVLWLLERGALREDLERMRRFLRSGEGTKAAGNANAP